MFQILKKMNLYDYIFNIYIYILIKIYIYIYIKRVLRVLIPGVTVSVSDTHISVSSVSRVLVSCDLGGNKISYANSVRNTLLIS